MSAQPHCSPAFRHSLEPRPGLGRPAPGLGHEIPLVLEGRAEHSRRCDQNPTSVSITKWDRFSTSR